MCAPAQRDSKTRECEPTCKEKVSNIRFNIFVFDLRISLRKYFPCVSRIMDCVPGIPKIWSSPFLRVNIFARIFVYYYLRGVPRMGPRSALLFFTQQKVPQYFFLGYISFLIIVHYIFPLFFDLYLSSCFECRYQKIHCVYIDFAFKASGVKIIIITFVLRTSVCLELICFHRGQRASISNKNILVYNVLKFDLHQN